MEYIYISTSYSKSKVNEYFFLKKHIERFHNFPNIPKFMSWILFDFTEIV